MRESETTIIDRSVRLAVIVLLQRDNHAVTSQDIASWFGVCLRSAQRDLKIIHQAHAKLAEILDKLNHPEPVEKTYTVHEAAELLKLNPYRIRELANSLHFGAISAGVWRFTEADIEALRNRPNARRKITHRG